MSRECHVQGVGVLVNTHAERDCPHILPVTLSTGTVSRSSRHLQALKDIRIQNMVGLAELLFVSKRRTRKAGSPLTFLMSLPLSEMDTLP